MFRGAVGGVRMQGNKPGCWGRALWLPDRHTDRQSLFELLLPVPVQLWSSSGPWVLCCAAQSFLSVRVVQTGGDFSLDCLWLYCSNIRGTQRRQQLCHEAVPYPGRENTRFSISVLNKKHNKIKASFLALFFFFFLVCFNYHSALRAWKLLLV